MRVKTTLLPTVNASSRSAYNNATLREANTSNVYAIGASLGESGDAWNVCALNMNPTKSPAIAVKDVVCENYNNTNNNNIHFCLLENVIKM